MNSGMASSWRPARERHCARQKRAWMCAGNVLRTRRTCSSSPVSSPVSPRAFARPSRCDATCTLLPRVLATARRMWSTMCALFPAMCAMSPRS
eukprot:7377795-Prymnesium_polylepis.2